MKSGELKRHKGEEKDIMKKIKIRGKSLLLVGLLLIMSVQPVSAATISNPRIITDSSMTAGQKVTWDCVWFGTYPQTEIVAENNTKQIAALEEMNTNYETKYEKIDTAQYKKIVNASYDSNNDAVVDGVKYRRMKKPDALYTEDDSSYYYRWIDTTSYHYYKHEPIKWRVLYVDDSEGKMLLFSDIALDNQKDNTTPTDFIWEKSTIRSWLNNYSSNRNADEIDYSTSGFLKTAFTSVEQTVIKSTSVENLDFLTYETYTTTDKIFLLSESEVHSTDSALRYGFVESRTIEDEARRTKPSTYAYSMGAYRSDVEEYKGNCWWWLRSPYDSSLIDYSGWGADDGYDFDDNDSYGVRPALYLDLSYSDLYSYAGTVCSDGIVNETVTEKNTSGDKEVFPGKKESADANSSTKKPTNPTSGNSNGGSTRKGNSVSSKKNSGSKKKKTTSHTWFQKGVLTSAKSPSKKKIKIKWKKIKSATGYQLQVSLNKKFKKKTIERSFKRKITKTTMTYMESKKKYYIRIRPYKKVGKTNYYGKWSKTKMVKVK